MSTGPTLADALQAALLAAGVGAVVWGERRKRGHPRPAAQDDGRIRIGGVPIPPEIEPLHILVSGSTGTGKSQMISGILDTIRARGDRAIVADPGGQYMSRWHADGDTILAPLDARSVAWSPFAEMRAAQDADRIARSMIPSIEGQSDAAQWQLYSQGLVAAALQRLHESQAGTNSALVHTLTIAKSDEIESVVRGLPAQTLFDTGAAKMVASVRGIVGSYLPPYRFLPPDAGGDAWSIRRWVEAGDGWLWMPYRDSERAALAPLIAAWIGEAVSAVLDLEPSRERRVWLILDEAPLLGRVQALADALTNGRKYGLRAILGVQSIAQLRQAYGRDGAQVLLSCLSSALVLRVGDAETADAMSRMLGDRQIRREHESRQLSLAGGASASEHITIERAVLPSEIQSLPDRRGYLRLAGDYPIALVDIDIVEREQRVPPHVRVGDETAERRRVAQAEAEMQEARREAREAGVPTGAVPAPGPAIPAGQEDGEVERDGPVTIRPISAAEAVEMFFGPGAMPPEPERERTPPKLTIELVPSTAWFSNVRDHVTSTDWERIKKFTSAAAGGRCEICGGRGPQWPVECHEVWHYDDERHVQTLVRTQALCPDCHRVKHIGLADVHGKGEAALKHLAKVNGWTLDQARRYRDEAFRTWRARSQHEWMLDLSWLRERFGISVAEKR